MSDPQLTSQWRIETNSIPQLDNNLDIYAIIEPELWPDWQARLYQKVVDPIHVALFEKTQFANIEKGPVLISLNEQAEMFNLVQEQMQATPCGCLLYVSKGTPLNSLLMNLRRGLVVMTDKATALLRYYEPRTLLPLLGAMNDEERGLFFAGLTQIYWYQKQWLSGRIVEPIHPPQHYQWTLTSEHISKMQSILTQWNGVV